MINPSEVSLAGRGARTKSKKVKSSLLAIAYLFLATVGSAAHAQMEAYDSRTLLTSSSSPSAYSSSGSAGAVTLDDGSSAATPIKTGSEANWAPLFTVPSQIPASSTGTSAPAAPLVAPELGFASQTLSWDADSSSEGSEIQPVPGPSTWCAAALLATILLWRLRHRVARWSSALTKSQSV